MADLEEISRILGVDETGILSRPVAVLGTELDMAKDALLGMRTIRIAERVIELPGMVRHENIILKTLASFKKKAGYNVVPLPWAGADEVVIEALRPQVFGVNTYAQTGIAAGATVELVPVGGTAGKTWDAVKDEELVVITDLVELKSDNIITAIKVQDIDGRELKPEGILRQIKLSNFQVYELTYPIIADLTLDLDGYAEAAGETEIVPCGVHIALGRQIPTLSV